MRRLFALVVLVASFGAQAADVLYVDDKLYVTIRAGQGTGYKVLTTLESGARLEVLERGDDYIRVRDPKGNEGWTQMRYLTDQPIARDRLAVAEQKLVALEADKQRLKEQLSAIEKEKSDARKGRSQMEQEVQRLQTELSELQGIAAAPLKLSTENKAMRDRLGTLEDENRRLREENERLSDKAARDWFLTGAGVLSGGILLGLILPKLRRRRSSWGDL